MSRESKIPAWFFYGLAILGVFGVVGGIAALLGNRKWSPLIYVMASAYLLSFPIGTILGYVMLKGLPRYLDSRELIRQANPRQTTNGPRQIGYKAGMRISLSIRDLVWAALVVVVTLGWWIDRTRLNDRNESDIQGMTQGLNDHMKAINIDIDRVTGENDLLRKDNDQLQKDLESARANAKQ